MAKNMKDFIKVLEEKYPEEIIHVKKGPLYPHKGECTAILYHFEKNGKWPMGVFDNVIAYSGKKWPGSTQHQADGTFSKLSIALDLPPDQWTPYNYFDTLRKRLINPVPPVIVDEKDAYVKYTVLTGNDANIYDLPIFLKDEWDAKPGWLCGVIAGKRLGTGRYNLSWHRLLALGEKRAPSRIQYRHLWEYMQEYKAAGYKEIPIAWIFGHHPMFMLASAIKCSYAHDEYNIAGGMLNEPLRITPSSTWGKDFMIPADAEVVVEGYLSLHDFDFNGPWGDFMRYYSPQTLEPVFTPTAFNYAKDPIFDNHIARHDLYTMSGKSLSFYSAIKERYPRVKAAYHAAPYVAIIQFKPQHPGEATRMGLLALTSANDTLKQVIVVDEDCNPFDLHDVLFSLGTRVDANTDQVQVIKNLDANRHDPSAFEYMKVGGFIIDATRPAGKPFPDLSYPGKELLERIKAEEYLDKKTIEIIKAGLGYDIHPSVN